MAVANASRGESIVAVGKDVVKAVETYSICFLTVGPTTHGKTLYEDLLIHYTIDGLWVNYNLMTSVPGLFAAGEANFSDHGANRLGASALMQGLADGYFVLPYTIGDYLADDIRTGAISTDSPEFEEAESKVKNTIDSLINNDGDTPVDDFHRRLGLIMWNKCSMVETEGSDH